ncbi:MAG: DNA-3-methyladenine glycosylase family protein [Actinomycetota bacterium]
MRTRTFRCAGEVDVRLTCRELSHGGGDPTITFGPGGVTRSTTTPEGPATIQLINVDRTTVTARAWGAGGDWALAHAPELVGAGDHPEDFRPAHPGLRYLQRRMSGMRFTRSLAVVEALVPTILEQKVTSGEAHHSYRRLVMRYGEPAPGPFGLRLPPAPGVLSRLPYEEFHPLGIERRRAETIRSVCSRATPLEQISTMAPRDALARLTAMPGIGLWSAANVMQLATGDADAVLVGDFHLPHAVAWFLAGEARASDERMLELLEPYRGQRARAIRLIAYSGRRAPKFGPRNRLRNIAAI